MTNTQSEVATLGAGCFWCVDTLFRELRGVTGVVSGYAGGTRANPSYEQVCTGATGHAEVVQVEFCEEAVEVVGEGVIVVPDAWLARVSKAAAVVGDDAKASVQQRRDLLLPTSGR